MVNDKDRFTASNSCIKLLPEGRAEESVCCAGALFECGEERVSPVKVLKIFKTCANCLLYVN